MQSIVLGIVQGLTEFIPISSSAHLVVVPWLFGWTDPLLRGLGFDVALHLGTLIAVLVYFAPDWARLAGAWYRSVVERRIGADADRRIAWLLMLACIPGAVAGFLLEGRIGAAYHPEGRAVSPAAMIVMAAIIAAFGLLLLLADYLFRHTRPFGSIRLPQALPIGLAQALAVIPGVSRSGVTLAAGLACGLEREAAARFSFLLSAPIIAGAGLKGLYDLARAVRSGATAPGELIYVLIGFLAAAVSGFFCIRFLLNYLRRHSTLAFAYYRWALALLILIVAFGRAR